MKLATVALASVFALSSTFAVAETHQYTSHHKYKSASHHKYKSAGRYQSGVRPYQGTVGMGNYGNPNNRGGLVGGSDPGTYKP
jgi:hypothetical protein